MDWDGGGAAHGQGQGLASGAAEVGEMLRVRCPMSKLRDPSSSF
jgi:hypothetical protein